MHFVNRYAIIPEINPTHYSVPMIMVLMFKNGPLYQKLLHGKHCLQKDDWLNIA